MNAKQKLFHKRLIMYLESNGLKHKDAVSAANASIKTLIKQGDGFKLSNVPKMGKWLLKEKNNYIDSRNIQKDDTPFFDPKSGSLFRRLKK